MDEANRQAGREIDLRREGLAEAILDLQYRRQPELQQRYSGEARRFCLQDIGYHLSYLSEAVALSSPSLFTDYLAWAKVLLSGLGLPDRDLIVNLGCMREVLEKNLPAGTREVVADYLEQGLRRLDSPPEEPGSFLRPDAPLDQLARGYLDALLSGERHTAGRLVLEAAEGGTPVRDIYLQVFQPCQRETGRLWQNRSISVAQEHYCTAATQLVMSQLYPYIFSTERKGLTCVTTSVSGELHELGIRMVSDFLEMEGWDTYYLGANTPTASILKTLQERGAQVLGVSSTMAFHVGIVRDLIEAVRADEACRGVKIMVGGYPFNAVDDLWQKIGADGSAGDAEEAVRVAVKFVRED
jgi:methanogenic corrinoid protein MtbC1